MLGVRRPEGAACASGPAVCLSTISRRLRPLSEAVQLSHVARPLYGGMLWASALSHGAARSRPPGFGAGRGSVGRAMGVCAQARCETLIHPWSSSWRLNHQIHMLKRSSGVHSLGVRSAGSCCMQMLVAPCGFGATAKRLLVWRP